MVELFITLILIALTATYLTEYSSLYIKLLKAIRLNKKPFNCGVCLSFWLGIILIGFCYLSLGGILAVFATPMIQIVLSRLIGLLPMNVRL